MSFDNYESFGRYPKSKPFDVKTLFWRSEIPNLSEMKKSVLVYAYGKSYGDVCLNDGGILIDTKRLNRLISFDSVKGVLRCESGMTLAEILDFIIPHGWFLSVTPGTKLISVGGAIANDVHGKNHHVAGTFGNHVIKFELVRSDGERLICSKDENSDLFKATIGGLGLTGLITWAEFKLSPSPTPFFSTESEKFDNVDEFFEINEYSEKNFDYIVSWIDCTSTGSKLGRGLYNRGNNANPEKDVLPKLPKQGTKNFPFDAPFINSLTVNLFNMLFYNKQINKIEKQVVHYNPYFYPLDAIYNWNKAYGKNGFIQYQFLIPFGREKTSIKIILKHIAESGLSSFLTVMKTFGDIKSPGMLSFPRPGVNLAIDFRFSGEKTLTVLNELDNYIREAGGIIYPAKDARMSAKDFQSFYPQWKEFSKYIDPKFSSSFWRRVTQEL